MRITKFLPKLDVPQENTKMPLKKLETNDESLWALWKVEEEENKLMAPLEGIERIPDALTNTHKRLEWAAAHALVKLLMDRLNIPFQGIVKNEFGKPFPIGSGYQLSLSHSFPYVGAYLHPFTSVGIDLEQPTPKLLKVASRIHSPEELHDAGNDVEKHCLYWCAKEVLVKVYGKKDLIFAENLKITPFLMKEKGEIDGRIIVNGITINVPMHYEVFPDFIVVLNKP